MSATRLMLVLAALAVAAGTAFAQAKREDVKAEAASANKAGATKVTEGSTGPAGKPMATKPRAEVKAEAASANKAGATKVGEGEAGKK